MFFVLKPSVILSFRSRLLKYNGNQSLKGLYHFFLLFFIVFVFFSYVFPYKNFEDFLHHQLNITHRGCPQKTNVR